MLWVIFNRLKAKAEELLTEEEAGFHQARTQQDRSSTVKSSQRCSYKTSVICSTSCTLLFTFYLYWLSTRRCPLSHSFHTVYKCLALIQRQLQNTLMTLQNKICQTLTVHLAEVERFRTWCKDNWLGPNVMKTKEVLIDFRKNSAAVPQLFIDGVKVNRVISYKYL